MKHTTKGISLRDRYILWRNRNQSKMLKLAGLSFISALVSVSIQAGWTIHSINPNLAEVTVARAEAVPELPMKEWVLNAVKEANLDPYEAYVIINCESKWKSDAVNLKNRNGSWDAGLWMVNSIHKDISNADKFDYKKATQWAIQKRLKDGSWKAWTCSKQL